MKERRVVPSPAPITTIVVQGKAHHYFHSEILGKCRAIIIDEAENLPFSPPKREQDFDPWDDIDLDFDL